MLWAKVASLSRDITKHRHHLHEFFVCIEGRGEVVLNNGRYPFKKGDSMFLPANMEHAIINFPKSDSDSLTKLFFACIDDATYSTLSTPLNRVILTKMAEGKVITTDESVAVGGKNDDEESELSAQQMLTLTESYLQQNQTKGLYQDALKESLFLQMLLLHSRNIDESSEHQYSGFHRIIGATHFIHEHYHEDMSLERVARWANMSRSHFARQFKQHTGYSVIDYLLKVRCDAAAKRLAETCDDVADIAFDSGFGNLSHFHRHFKRRYDVTPLAFRKMQM